MGIGVAMINEKDKQEYLSNPNHCPNCKGENITAGNYDFEGSSVWSEVSCDDCHFKWHDIYDLKDVEEVKK